MQQLHWLLLFLCSLVLSGLCERQQEGSHETVSYPVRHSLPSQSLQSLFGSNTRGKCSSIIGRDQNICNGTSVLNDGQLPSLTGVSNDRVSSHWAEELFTLRRNGTAGIVVSFEVEPVNHDRIELVVFNCPEYGIYTPIIKAYYSVTFQPDIPGSSSLGTFIVNQSLSSPTSCDHLIKFCVDLNSAVSLPYFNLEFPYQNNSDYVFLGEVTFVNRGAQPCSPPELIESDESIISPTTEDGTEVTHRPLTMSESVSENDTIRTLSNSVMCTCTGTALTAGVVSALVSALLVAGISVAIHIAVYQCLYKPRLRSEARLQGVFNCKGDHDPDGTSTKDTVWCKGSQEIDGDKSEQDDSGHEYAVIYEVVRGKRKGSSDDNTALTMTRNQVYGLTDSMKIHSGIDSN